jgi:hypothetical protein
MGITYSTVLRKQPTLIYDKVGNHHIQYCSKCFDGKYVVVASSDIEINSKAQGDN